MSNLWPAVGTVVAALLGLVGVVLVQRNARRAGTTDVTQRIIDQLQENHQNDRQQWAKERESLEQRQARLEQRLEQSEAVQRLLLDYVGKLRKHIDEGSPPPPPAWPAEWPT